MSETDIASYVRAALPLQGYAFGADEVAAITEQFSRIAAIANAFLDMSLPLHAEPAPVFHP